MSESWVDGHKASQISLWDRGLHYGDGFFTTVRVEAGRLLNWPAHQQRIRHSLSMLGMPAQQFAWLEDDLKKILPQIKKQQGILKCIFTRGDMAGHGYRPSQTQKVRRIVLFRDHLPARLDAPLTVSISPVLWPTPDVYPGIKHLNRLAQVEAMRRLAEDTGEALMLNARHEVISGIASAVVARLGRVLYLPDLSEAGVDSTAVFALRQCVQRVGYQVQTTRLTLGRLMQMDALALLNAIRGVQPVCEVRGTVAVRFATEPWQEVDGALQDVMHETAWAGA